MSGYDLSADPERLEGLASTIAAKVEALRNEIAISLGSMTSLGDQWQDARYQQFEEKSLAGFELLREIVDTLSDMEVFLRQRARSVQDYLDGN